MWGILVYIIGQEDIIKINVHVFSGISIKKIYRSLCVKSKRYKHNKRSKIGLEDIKKNSYIYLPMLYPLC